MCQLFAYILPENFYVTKVLGIYLISLFYIIFECHNVNLSSHKNLSNLISFCMSHFMSINKNLIITAFAILVINDVLNLFL